MRMRSVRRGIAVLFAALPLIFAGRAHAQTQAFLHPDNGVWLPDYTAVKSVPTVLATMQGYGVNKLFLLNGGLSASGTMGAGYAVAWMNAIHNYEVSSGYTFEVFVDLPATIGTANGDCDISSSTVQASIAATCAKFTSATVTGSYVSGANRTFDGVVLDLEPGGVYGNANAFEQLGQQIRTAIGTSKRIAFYTPAYSATISNWSWNITEYYYMTGYSKADYLLVGDYDSGQQTASAYQSYVQNQVYNVLRAVSGIGYNDPTGHPVPNVPLKVLFGLPAFGENATTTSPHNPAAENIVNAALGINAGLTEIDATSASFFEGADVFAETNGDGSDGTATYAKDWPNFYAYWVQPLPNNPAPSASSILPSSASAGTNGVTITVSGANFVNQSVVRWNGVALPTTYVNSATLTAQVPASDLATAGQANVTVFSPILGVGGGGTSTGLTFTITSN